jgi:hypothetical protein
VTESKRSAKHTRQQLELSLLSDAQDHEAWQVYADLLLEQGEKHQGELLQIAQNIATGDDRPQLLSRRDQLREQLRQSLGKPRMEWNPRGVLISVVYENVAALARFERHKYPFAAVRLSPHSFPRFDAATIVRSPHIAFVDWLDLRYCRAVNEDLEALANTHHLPHLKTLDLRYTDLAVEGIEAIAQSSRLPSLETLMLGGAGADLADDIISAIATSSQLGSLETLDLRRANISQQAVLAICESESLSLTTLRLVGMGLATDSANAIADSPCLAALETLDLRGNRICNAGFHAIATSPHFALEALDLSNNGNDLQTGDLKATTLASARRLSKLRSLVLNASGIGDPGAKAIANSPYLKSLVTLELVNNEITDDGAKALAASPNLASLARLLLKNNDIGLAGALALARSPHLAEGLREKLRRLFGLL